MRADASGGSAGGRPSWGEDGVDTSEPVGGIPLLLASLTSRLAFVG